MKFPSIPILIVLLAAFFCAVRKADCRETIKIDGQVIRNCELVEISQKGPIYKSGDTGELHIVPWKQLSPVQQNVLRTQHQESLVNALCEARFVDGTVFNANKDGVIVQITIDENAGERGTKGYLNGGQVLTGGMVLITDLPLEVPRSDGDPIKVIAYYTKTGEFDMGIAKTDIEYLSTQKPAWFRNSDWTDKKGRTMQAQLLWVKDGKGLFLKSGQKIVVELNLLDEASQAKAKEYQGHLGKKLQGPAR